MIFDISIKSEFTSKNAQVATSEIDIVPNIINSESPQPSHETKWNEFVLFFCFFRNSNKNGTWNIETKYPKLEDKI